MQNAIVMVESITFATSTNSRTNEVALSLQFNEKPLEILFSKEQVELIIHQFSVMLPEITLSCPITQDIDLTGATKQ